MSKVSKRKLKMYLMIVLATGKFLMNAQYQTHFGLFRLSWNVMLRDLGSFILELWGEQKDQKLGVEMNGQLEMDAKSVLTSAPSTTSSWAPFKSLCSHLCLLTSPEQVCACPISHELNKDNSWYLVLVLPDALLLYSRRDIRNISSKVENEDILILLNGVAEESAVDYGRLSGRIY
jgi:hypothetical protein